MVKYWDRLKPEMDAKKMDITKFSEAMGISFQAVAKVRDGGSFGTKNNIKAAELLGLSSDWLATGKGEKTPPFNYLPADIEWINQHIGEDEHEAAVRFASSDSGKALMLESAKRSRSQPIDRLDSPEAGVEVIAAALALMTEDQREAMAGKLAALARAPDSPTLKKSISASLASTNQKPTQDD